MSITYLEAIREAQAKLLRDDERVFIYGQDVGGTFGGAFKATKGLAKETMPARITGGRMYRSPLQFVCPLAARKAAGHSTVNRWNQFMRITRGSSS